METIDSTKVNFENLVHQLGGAFSERAKQHDKEGTFVSQNYEDLKKYRFFSAMVPLEFGGGGVSFNEMCQIIKTMAHYCGSTALAFSMHQHLVAATVWKYKHKGEGAPLLKRLANEQLVLVSTGAKDWLESSGTMIRTEGGYLVTAKKPFASQSVEGDIAVSSGQYMDEEGNKRVLHFSVPLNKEGISILDDWQVMSMRGTGSQSIQMENVFIPDAAIALNRPAEGFPPVWNLVLSVALPLIMSVYVGLAEKALEVSIDLGKKNKRNQPHFNYMIGKMNNSLISTKAQWIAMQAITNNFEVLPNENLSIEMVSYKTNIADACMHTVQEALEAAGGQSLYKKNNLEKIFRDIQAAQFHPMPKWEQYAFCGERLINKY